MKKQYPSNLTDNQYEAILRIIGDTRKRRRSLRDVFDALFYVLKAGCQWRLLPGDFPPWQSVYYYFRKWSLDGTLKKIHSVLRGALRRCIGREISPSVGKAIPAITLVVTIVLLYYFGGNLTLITSGSRSYYLMFDDVGIAFLYRFLFLLSAVLLSISVISLVPTLNKVSTLGRDTIFYYVYHGFAVVVLERVVGAFNLPTNLLGLMVYTISIMLGIFVLSKLKIASILLNPISYFMKR